MSSGVSSAGESDPYFTQKHMLTQKNRLARHASQIKQIKQIIAGKDNEMLNKFNAKKEAQAEKDGKSVDTTA